MKPVQINALAHSAAIQPLKFAPRPASRWVELSPILMGIVGECRPIVTVELGSNEGVAICAVNQVIKPYNAGLLDSRQHQRSFSVDPDEPLRKPGSAEAKVRVEMGKYFTSEYGKFGSIISFDCEQSRYYIPDECAHLLVFGLNRPYDELRHTFDRWRGKLDPGCICLIPGTQGAEPATEGHARLFRELAADYPSFELTNGGGLGIVDLGGQLETSPLAELFGASDEVKEAVRQHFAVVGQRMLQATGHLPG